MKKYKENVKNKHEQGAKVQHSLLSVSVPPGKFAYSQIRGTLFDIFIQFDGKMDVKDLISIVIFCHNTTPI